MARNASGLKRLRQSQRRGERNQARRTAARGAVRGARESIAGGNQEEAQEALRRAAAVLDRAAQKGVLHPNNAARRKSRLMRLQRTTLAAAGETAPRRRSASPSRSPRRASKKS